MLAKTQQTFSTQFYAVLHTYRPHTWLKLVRALMVSQRLFPRVVFVRVPVPSFNSRSLFSLKEKHRGAGLQASEHGPRQQQPFHLQTCVKLPLTSVLLRDRIPEAHRVAGIGNDKSSLDPKRVAVACLCCPFELLDMFSCAWPAHVI